MKIAVLSDIHANATALTRCIDDALHCGAESFWLLGDYVCDLADVQETMALLRQLMARYPCTLLRGNKEDYWLGDADTRSAWREGSSATGTLLYTYRLLTEEDMALFRSLPEAKTMRVDGLPPVLLCHGSPESNRGTMRESEHTRALLSQVDTPLILCGHTHQPYRYTHAGVTVINPGAVGVALGTCGLADYLLLTGENGTWHAEQRLLPYDVEAAIGHLHTSGLDRMAPCWTRSTIHILRHGGPKKTEVVARAAQLYSQWFGAPPASEIPECCWLEALEQLGIP